ncbi:hypothetical protein K458DRAFT_429885 [Lentithecium fluviatile CBS 122367]|uniref:Uncharacterized protein n=1 Tax=Lentithecium fluviatile CBS 122367 TaxID=1168545 RepID=A0A6G1J8Z2_9PLEO|nr:hypothetical protein K458DRAFT_429885 [Lentithecium fluviatile CBS 122367]
MEVPRFHGPDNTDFRHGSRGLARRTFRALSVRSKSIKDRLRGSDGNATLAEGRKDSWMSPDSPYLTPGPPYPPPRPDRPRQSPPRPTSPKDDTVHPLSEDSPQNYRDEALAMFPDSRIVTAFPWPPKSNGTAKSIEAVSPRAERPLSEVRSDRTVRFSPLATPTRDDKASKFDSLEIQTAQPQRPHVGLASKPYHEVALILRQRARKAARHNLFHERTEPNQVPLSKAVGRIAAQTYYTINYHGPAKGVGTDSLTRRNVMSVYFMVPYDHMEMVKEILLEKGDVIKQNHLLSLAYGNSEINILPEAKVLIYTLDDAPSVQHMEPYLKATLDSLATIYEGQSASGVTAIGKRHLWRWTKEEAPPEWEKTDLVVMFRDPDNDAIEPFLGLIHRYGKVHFDGIKMDPGSATVFGTLKFGNHHTGILVIPSQPVAATITCWRMLVIRYLYAYMGLKVPASLVTEAKPFPRLIRSAASIPSQTEVFRPGTMALSPNGNTYFAYRDDTDEVTRLSIADSWARFEKAMPGLGDFRVPESVKSRPFGLRVEAMEMDRRKDEGVLGSDIPYNDSYSELDIPEEGENRASDKPKQGDIVEMDIAKDVDDKVSNIPKNDNHVDKMSG